jgi:purine-binding chemotaxis protein CheW
MGRAAPIRNVIVFALGSARYAVELRWVREVFALGHVTPVPRAPVAVLGVVNLRGAIVSVLDLEALIGRRAPDAPAPPAQAGESAILLEVEGVSAALRVSSVVEVSSLTPAEGDAKALIDSSGRQVPLADPPELLARALHGAQSAAGVLLAELGS